jgi:multidrug resistance efflux pump
MNYTRRGFLMAGVGVLLAACSGQLGAPDAQNAQPTSTPIPTLPALAPTTYTVQRGDVINLLEFQGRWLSRDQNRLAFETGGLVRRVLVARGDTVTMGQLLADLDVTDLEDALASALLDLENAQAAAVEGVSGGLDSITDAELALANANLALESTRLNSPWQQGQTARLGLESAQRQLEQAQRAYDDVISRPDSAASTVDGAYQALLSAQEGVRSAQVSYGSAGQAWATYQVQLEQAENSVREAELRLERARSGTDASEAGQRLRAAQLRVDQIRADIARSSLYSPIDGVVLEITIQSGEQAAAYEAVITVGRPQPLEAIANVTYTDAQKMGVGLIGVCHVLNQPDTAVQCIVRRVPLTPNDADQTVRVAATLPAVLAGQIIQIAMPLETRANVLWLPPQAVRTFQTRVFVVLQTPEGQRRADIQIGLRTEERVEIVSGVDEGDVVIGS